MNEVYARLWLAVRLPHLPYDALNIEADSKPVIVVEKNKVIYANEAAVAAGALLGMDGPTAQLLTNSLSIKRDVVKEQLVLDELAGKLYQFTPYIRPHVNKGSPDSGLLLEISSCLMLFSGLKAMTQKIGDFLTQNDIRFSFGLAHSEYAAWFLSFADYEITGDEDKELFREQLSKVAIDVLVDYPKILDSLSKTGFRTFGDITAQIQQQSLASFRKRYGDKFTETICEIYGVYQVYLPTLLFEKPRQVYVPQEQFEEELQFEFPVALIDLLKPAMEILLQKLGDYLRKRQEECQYIQWTIFDIYDGKEQITVKADTPQSHWALLYDLSVIQFDAKELPFEVDTIKLTCLHSMPMERHSNVLDFEDRRRSKSIQDFAVVIAKLKARLGEDAVYKLSYHDSRLPELNSVIISLAEKANQTLPAVYKKALYPTWIFTKPALIGQRNNRLFWHGYVSPLVGPERVIGEWWSKTAARDYYLAQRQDHVRLWIYFDLYEKHWYVHGVFA